MKWKLFKKMANPHPPPLDYVPAPPEVPPQQEVEIDAMSMRQPRLSLICPYHEEDTGSLVLNTRQDTFHCFGCGAEGEIKKIVAVLERK